MRAGATEADALVMHALIINIALGLTCSAIMLAFGRPIYRALGGEGAALEAALAYSNVVFAGNVLLWVLNGFASVIRGTGNMLVPASVICAGVVVLLPLSPVLIFGLGPFPALGIAGGGVALLVFYAAGTAVLSLVHPVAAATSPACDHRRCAGRCSATSSASARSRPSPRCRPT